ncbi:hypothetical protein [Kribbella solani]|uniref:hypothetical protein n=1 Tax=Kribbella solani TaxID=236067 RepID=UPI0029A36F64|nr:hypothetical protein [Kribbella solani]MDX2972067.1 hypothetical protein [Kribbella solani]
MSHQGVVAACSDVATMIDRSVRLARRNVDTLFASILLPLLMMALFVYVFGGAINTGTQYVNYVVPGILLLTTGYGDDRPAAFTADPELRGTDRACGRECGA